MNNYFLINDLEYQDYLSMPRGLVYNSKISSDIKIMYCYLMDRLKLSVKNNWYDNDCKVYLIYSIEEIMNDFQISKPTAVNLIKELKELDFIEVKRRGQGLANLIYVKKIDFDKMKEESKQRKEEFRREQKEKKKANKEENNNKKLKKDLSITDLNVIPKLSEKNEEKSNKETVKEDKSILYENEKNKIIRILVEEGQKNESKLE